MANEVLIREYSTGGQLGRGGVVPVYNEDNLITTQVVDIATRSAAFNTLTKFVTITSIGTGFWYIFGTSAVNATANTAGNSFIAAGQTFDFAVDTHTNIDTAAAV